MNRSSLESLYRCDLCHGWVDVDTTERARRAWQPLIICDRCVRDAPPPAPRQDGMAAIT